MDKEIREEVEEFMKGIVGDSHSFLDIGCLVSNYFGAILNPQRNNKEFWETLVELAPKLYPIRPPTQEEIEEGRQIRKELISAENQLEYEERIFMNRISFQSPAMQSQLWRTYSENDRHYKNGERQRRDLESKLDCIAYRLIISKD